MLGGWRPACAQRCRAPVWCVLQVKVEPPPQERPACAAAAPKIHRSSNDGEGAPPFTGALPQRPGGAFSDCQPHGTPCAATPTVSKNATAEHGGAFLHETAEPGGRGAWQPAQHCHHHPAASAGAMQRLGSGFLTADDPLRFGAPALPPPLDYHMTQVTFSPCAPGPVSVCLYGCARARAGRGGGGATCPNLCEPSLRAMTEHHPLTLRMQAINQAYL